MDTTQFWFLISGTLIIISAGVGIVYLCRNKNAWDIAFFNLTYALLMLFIIGTVVNDKGIWQIIIHYVGTVAVGSGIISGVLEYFKYAKEIKSRQD